MAPWPTSSSASATTTTRSSPGSPSPSGASACSSPPTASPPSSPGAASSPSAPWTEAQDGTIEGALNLVQAVRANAARALSEVADRDVFTASPEDDVIGAVTRMADFNLLAMPVLAEDRCILGVIAVDDALEAAIPEDWSRRGHIRYETGRDAELTGASRPAGTQ
jgi:hypothetical protein